MDGFNGGGNMYYGQRTTGMGRTASGDSGMSQVTASHPQDQPRKRLRRGGPGGEDVRILYSVTLIVTASTNRISSS